MAVAHGPAARSSAHIVSSVHCTAHLEAQARPSHRLGPSPAARVPPGLVFEQGRAPGQPGQRHHAALRPAGAPGGLGEPQCVCCSTAGAGQAAARPPVHCCCPPITLPIAGPHAARQPSSVSRMAPPALAGAAPLPAQRLSVMQHERSRSCACSGAARCASQSPAAARSLAAARRLNRRRSSLFPTMLLQVQRGGRPAGDVRQGQQGQPVVDGQRRAGGQL